LRILYLAHRLPDAPDKGCKIRAFHQLSALGSRHEVHLLSLGDPPSINGHGRALSEMCASIEVFPVRRPAAYLRCVLQAPRGRPATLAFFHSAALWRRCAELAASRRFDLVVAYSAAMAPYAAQLPDVPALLDLVDVDSAKWAQYARLGSLAWRPIYALEARRLRRYESGVGRQFARVLVSTGQERDLLAEIAPQTCVEVVANGVDRDWFRPLQLPKSPTPMLVFTGQMDYFANVDAVDHFARTALPRLRDAHADLSLVIVGRQPTARVRALAELPGVSVTGAVEDVRPFLARAWAFVAPLRIAQGIQNKVLEAMAMEVPVACSDRVLRGLAEGGFRDGEDLLAAAPEALSGRIAGLLADPALGRRLAASAASKLSEAYCWDRNMARFATLCEQVAGEPRRADPHRAPMGVPSRPRVGHADPAMHATSPPASAS
jgi:polysaccharide biosynthesis protein PslH